ncbi:hypothetical protein MHBO_004758 [Bonamia ostreae]|uniref:Uncharacterized protein n=1 Tax=Bonamia ostreae TaxID=126728 RepID=A0ABV2AU66_9EUKA
MLNQLISYSGEYSEIDGDERLYTLADAVDKKTLARALQTNMTLDDIRDSIEKQGFIKYVCD